MPSWIQRFFCGALVKPDGANMRILLAGNGGLFYEPVVAQSVIAEFISRAIQGLGHGPSLRRYTPEEVAAFIEALQPLLSPENSARVALTVHRISTAPPATPLDVVVKGILRRQIWHARRKLRGLGHLCLGDVDPKDLHIYVAAVEHHADYLVTSNVSDFPPAIGECRVVRPGEFLQIIGFGPWS